MQIRGQAAVLQAAKPNVVTWQGSSMTIFYELDSAPSGFQLKVVAPAAFKVAL